MAIDVRHMACIMSLTVAKGSVPRESERERERERGAVREVLKAGQCQATRGSQQAHHGRKVGDSQRPSQGNYQMAILR